MAEIILQPSAEQLLDQWLAAERQGVQFPVPFDLAWPIAGYSRKDHAKRKLTSEKLGLEENADFAFLNSGEWSQDGRSSDLIGLTCNTFKEFCLAAGTPEGKAARRYFIDAEKKWKLVQQIAPEVAREVELQQLKNEGMRLELQRSQAELQLIQFRHIITTTLPEPIQQKVLGYQVVEKVEYRDRIIVNEEIVNDGSTILKGELCRRYGILTRNGKPDYPRLNKILEQLPSDAFQLSVRPQENYELLRSHLPVLDKLMLDSTRQAWIGEGINS